MTSRDLFIVHVEYVWYFSALFWYHYIFYGDADLVRIHLTVDGDYGAPLNHGDSVLFVAL